MENSYPAPPWRTHGRAFFQPYLVRAESLRLPAGLVPRTIGGRALGILGFVEYVAPSPLTYRELVWMPCFVSVPVEGGRSARGWFVDTMVVDSEASRDGGRALWALPKRLARFELRGDREIRVETEDGARLVLDVEARGPAIDGPSDIATVQEAGDEVVRFRGSGRAKLRSGSMSVREASGLGAWTGWEGARRMPALGAALSDFRITMHEPKRMRRAT